MSGRDTFNISNNQFNNSAVVNHGVIYGGDIDQRGADLRALREAVAEARQEIVGQATDPGDRADAEHELGKIERELRGEEPDGPTVRLRWNSVLAVLDGAVAAGGRIAQVSDLVHKLFGG
jgi:hypothetical protein